MFHRKADKLKMVLGENSKITGNIESPGTIFVDGAIIGDVQGAKVILGENSIINGNINAGAIIIGGKIDGHLTATEKVEIKATGRVTGDIKTKLLVINEKGIFNGNSQMTTGEAKDEAKDGEQGSGKVVEFLAKEQ